MKLLYWIGASVATILVTSCSNSVQLNAQPPSTHSIATSENTRATNVQHLDVYALDPHHTNVRFAINHMKTSTVTGGFYELTGQVSFSADQQQGYIDINIPMTTIHTVSQKFVTTLKSKDFFNIATYPTARFVSTQWHFDSNDKGQLQSVKGMLSMNGQTKPVTLTAQRFNCYMSPLLKKKVCGGDFSTEIDRTQWGINKYVMMGVPKKVKLDIEIEAVKQ